MEKRPKPKSKPFAIKRNTQADQLLQQALYVVAGLVLAGAGVAAYWVWKDATEPEIIEAVVYLDNQCQIMDDAFMVVALPGGATSHFNNGQATIRVSVNGRLYVKSSPRFPSFQYETHKHKVLQPYTVIAATCGDHIGRTLDAMREQFRRSD